MSTILYDCPLNDTLPCPPKPDCPERFGQIQRAAFRLKQDPAAATPTFATAADILDQTKWTAALTATDETKIIVIPFMDSVVIPVGTVTEEEGNNNNTVNGVPLMSLIPMPKLEGQFRDLPMTIAEAIRGLTPYSAITPGFTNLEVFLFLEGGRILYRLQNGTIPRGFDAFNFVVGTVGTEGYGKTNVTPVSFYLASDWDKDGKLVNPMKSGTPTPWNPLELWNAC